MNIVDIHTWDDDGRGHYTLRMHCLNCGYKFVGRFIKGFRALGRYPCPSCGCNEATPTKTVWS